MRTRKELKVQAKKVLKRHYWLFVAICLVAAIFGAEFSAPINVETGEEATTAVSEKMTVAFGEFMLGIAGGNTADRQKEIEDTEERYAEESKAVQKAVLGRSRGVFAAVMNKAASGAFLMSLAVGIHSLVGSDSLTVAILLLGALILVLFVQVFIISVYRVVIRRMFLESRTYENVPIQRAWFLLRIKKWLHAGVVLLAASVMNLLWGLTIVGMFVKYYSYFLVPYIVAENPNIKAMEAVTLSRKLMKGHKWQCFILEMTFIGWDLLGIFTLGISNVLWTNPYKSAVMAEYYAELRRLGKEKKIENTELLSDEYLFEKADIYELEQVYADVEAEYAKADTELLQLKGIHRILANVFGVTIKQNKEMERLEEEQSRKFLLTYDKAALEGKTYPTRLYPIPEHRKRAWVMNLNYLRYYSVWSVIMLFFVMSFVGWIWEVSLHLVTDGVFVNRGVMHGPWLPIYGYGSVMILLLLNKFRRKPAAEFVLAVVLCGCVEYFTSYYLEIAHNGTKWWDYTGYFLNLNGRICAEGLLTFGVGGMAIVYMLAPFLDSLFRKIPVKALMISGLVLIGIFAADQVYSSEHPNEGKGITDYVEVSAPMEVAGR